MVFQSTAKARQGGLVILAASALLLGGCKDNGLLNLRGGAIRPPETRSFHAHLADEYRVLAEFAQEMSADTHQEINRGADIASIFYGKSESAANALPVNPESLSDYQIPAFAENDLNQARAQLVDALQNVNTPDNARMLALAQVQFDCWLAYQPFQKHEGGYIGCRESFQQAMSHVDFTKKTSNAPAATALRTPDPRTIHFVNDTMTLDPGAHAAIAILAEASLAQPGAAISLKGYSKTLAHIEDTSNNAVRRIIAVRNALYQNGVDPDNVKIEFLKNGDPQDVDMEVLPPASDNS